MNADEDLMEHPFYWLCRVCENERKKDIPANNNNLDVVSHLHFLT